MTTIPIYEHTCAEDQRRRKRRAVAVVALIALFALATYERPAQPKPRIETIIIRVPAPTATYSELSPLGPPPPPRASIAPESVSFERQLIGHGAPAKLITILNEGGHLLDLDVSLQGEAFAMTAACPRALYENMRCSLAIVFTPHRAGQYSGAVTINSRRIPLSGVAFAAEKKVEIVPEKKTDVIAEKKNEIDVDDDVFADPDPKELLPAYVDPANIVFTSPGREIVRITNPNDQPVRVTAIRIVDGNARGLQMPDMKKCIRTLDAEGFCEFAVIALPSAIRTRETIRLEVSSE